MTLIAELLAVVVILGLMVYHGFNLAMIIAAGVEIRAQRWLPKERLEIAALRSGWLPSVSVIVPAYNEEITIVRTIESVLRVSYPDIEVIVVSDGSTDRTLAALAESFQLRPSNERPHGELAIQRVRAVFESATDKRLLVIDKRNGGKADALNAGINMATKPLILAIDADVLLERFAVLHLALPFAMDKHVVATGGMIRPYNGCTIRGGRVDPVSMPATRLEGFQVLEYLRAYGIGRLFFNRLNAHLIISGAFGLFDSDVLRAIGGYQPHAIGEDMELVVRIHRFCADHRPGYRIWFSADALCLTEAPHTVKDLGKQRTRWHQGLLSVLRIHSGMALSRRYRTVGLLAFPYFMLEANAPILEALGWTALPILWWSGLLPASQIVAFIGVGVLLSTSVSFAAIFFDTISFSHFSKVSDRLQLVGYGVLEHFGYRQITVYFRLRAFYRYYRTIQLKAAWRPPRRMGAQA
jgi:cellulose synthase/poly-beta-1,6-N-acetylglucosamine synthase-like glycosyltransferase